MQRVLIVGLGLIGGSIGLALRRWSEERKVDGRKPLEIIGFDPNLDHQRAAEKLGAVDQGAWDLAKAARDADIVVLATPVNGMRDVMQDLAPQSPAGHDRHRHRIDQGPGAEVGERDPPSGNSFRRQSPHGREDAKHRRRRCGSLCGRDVVRLALRDRLRGGGSHRSWSRRGRRRRAVLHRPGRARRLCCRRQSPPIRAQRRADERGRARCHHGAT